MPPDHPQKRGDSRASTCCSAFRDVPGSHRLPNASVDLFCYLKANKKNKTKPGKPSSRGAAFSIAPSHTAAGEAVRLGRAVP